MKSKLLLKNVKAVTNQQELANHQLDILISEDGMIEKLGPDITHDNANLIEVEGLHVSPGWMDLGVFVGDPGFEHRETFESIAHAAAFGGFTHLATLPNNHPVTHSKTEVQYIKSATQSFLTKFSPLGAISKDCQGKDITEMMDMSHSGAIAFTDGLHPVQSGGMLKRALQYIKGFDSLIINQPYDQSMAIDGQIHEGTVSISLGMRGIPSIAESIFVQRDIQLLRYTESRLHLNNISTAESVALIRQAKAEGLNLTASVPFINLLLTDQALHTFDTHLKLQPPLRSERDRQALIEGLLDGTIDCITSNHLPQDEDAKKVEFPYAAFGMIGLGVAFAAAWKVLQEKMTIEAYTALWTNNVRNILQLPCPKIFEGETAELTLFLPQQSWTLTKEHLKSKSKNTALIGHTLLGKVYGVIRGNQSKFFKS